MVNSDRAIGIIASVWTQGTAFTYQGYLRQSGAPANGNYDFRFRLYTALTGGSQVGTDQFVEDVSVQNGLFTVTLNFGAAWDGSDRYLEIAVRPGASTGGYQELAPRVRVTPSPYAILASRLKLPFSGSANVGSGGVFSVTNTAPSGVTYSGYFSSASTSGRGVVGEATATSGNTYGVWGRSASSTNWSAGVFGEASATNGDVWGVYGVSRSTIGKGVLGVATATSGETYGGYFSSASTSGRGVYGWASATSGITIGVYGRSDSSTNRSAGVYGLATATSGETYGGYFSTASPSGQGVFGWASATSGITLGVYGRSDSSTDQSAGVYGVATATSGETYGVIGRSFSPSGYGVYAVGRFAATGTKAFQIDHPLSPETHYLNHFCVEGPEPYNLYRGNVTTDAQGYAVVQLPDYFEAVNRDPTYHLTVIDGSDDFILAKVVREIQNNRFVIRTSKPFVKVSWEVKAVRNDLWVQRYGYQTEQEKEDNFKGKYLNPELYGQPKERGVHQHPEPVPAPTEQAKP